ncbi:DUF563 domain-containing protein [Synechococcus sp. HJ21-Hayes]|uniref:hypothetical protein n=1 Tax=unclassified Synechococcus TaxID=2626047 RepID=UPI0020CDAF7C|nr:MULTISPECIES: hypothetical protein [unclassified Synechococcus]MCP9830286.1 DUF563 domain-containing protein [Synechococcus sp. JJ3a-Johnson]MCP9852989.1 DUF563 domain-containing protein [Synechococcus sp. HJ21-Hayes]
MPRLRDCLRNARFRFLNNRLFGYVHRQRPIGHLPVPLASADQAIVDLDMLSLPAKSGRVELVSHCYGYSPVPDYPGIESWALVSSASFGQAPAYARTQFDAIRLARRKPFVQWRAPVAVFPHSTSHFGHFVGDMLGSIVWFSRRPEICFSERQILATVPSPAWAAALAKLCPEGSLQLSTPEKLLASNLDLSDALVLPRLSTWQSLTLARDAVISALGDGVFADDMAFVRKRYPGEKIFLCSGRVQRIINLDMVCELFVSYGYNVVNPISIPVPELLARVSCASRLWCEQGSMVLNPLISRDRPYRLFALELAQARKCPASQAFLGGGLYNAFQRMLQRPFWCSAVDPERAMAQHLHPYQWQLQPDLFLLEAALKAEAEEGAC